MRAHVPPARSLAAFLGGALAIVLLAAGPAGASDDPNNALRKDEQKCVVEINKNVAKVAKAQGKRICKCIKNGTKSKNPPGQTIEQCTTADNKGKVAKAKAKTLAKEAGKCSTQTPDYGYTSGSTVNTEAVNKELSLIHRLFGSNLDASIVVLSHRYRIVDVLTLDERHFRVLRGSSGRSFRLLPADA